jgi:hypothetical protein
LRNSGCEAFGDPYGDHSTAAQRFARDGDGH